MAMLSYTCGKVTGLLKNKKIIPLLVFVILFTLNFGNIPLVVAQTDPQNNNDSKSLKKNYQRIIPLSSPLYREIDRLYLLAGKSRPSLSRPWSADEAKKAFEVLPDNFLDSVSDSAALIKREIEFGIEKTGEKKSALKISPEINIEGHIKTNDDRKEWEHGYEKRPPLLHIPFEGWFFTSLFMDIELAIKEEYAVVNLTDNYLNIPVGLSEIDWYFPFRAFISFGGEHWNIQIGRDKTSWGAGLISNMIISDYSDFYNLLKFSIYWERFKFIAVYMTFDPWLTGSEKDYRKAMVAEDKDLGGDYQDFNELFKAFMGHRIEVKILDNLSLALTEAHVIGNKYLTFTELNPVFVFHNLFTPEYTNVIFALEADYTPFNGFNIYFQFAMDEFQVPGYEDADTTRPGAMGFLGGLTFIKQAYDGYLSFNLEAALTDPYLYNRWHPNTRLTNRRRLWSYYHDRYDYINKPIGYRYGPDAIVMYGAVQYEKPDKYKTAVDAKYTLLGAKNKSLDEIDSYNRNKIAANLSTPSGTVESDLIFGLHGMLQFTKRISFASDIYYIHINNYQNTSGNTINDFEFTASAKFKF